MAARGLDCALLKPWEAAAIRAQALEPAHRWDTEERAGAIAEVKNKSSEMACDDGTMTTWINAARRGFDSEFLPPYLVIYRTLAEHDARPQVFDATSLRLDYAPAIEAINKKLAALEAAGAVPDGGQPWPDFIARTEKGAETILEALAGEGENERYTPDRAAAFIAQTALITELWLQDSLQASPK
ncbi:MAG: hypothetical protein DHS20C05_20280 [Hyphococcus sp.]|nr:MAG: hypothetical protein DHS20C05_20280 [Marinicaulis sp.]